MLLVESTLAFIAKLNRTKIAQAKNLVSLGVIFKLLANSRLACLINGLHGKLLQYIIRRKMYICY